MVRHETALDVQRPSGRQTIRAYRFLLVVYGVTFMVALWEISRRKQPVDLFLDPGANFTNTIAELYPKRSEALYARALQAGLCLQAKVQRRPLPAACQQFDSKDLKHEIRRYFEQALETHTKTNEALYYEYLQILVFSRAERAEIDAAYDAWRRRFPLSRLPDPR